MEGERRNRKRLRTSSYRKSHEKRAMYARSFLGGQKIMDVPVIVDVTNLENSNEHEQVLLVDSNNGTVHLESEDEVMTGIDDDENGSDEEILIEMQSSEDSPRIIGRRIFDVAYLVEQLKTFGNHSSLMGCSVSNMQFQKELREGFYTELHFKCTMCGFQEIIYSELKEAADNMGINYAAVFGNLCTGQSFAAMEERSSVMNMPCMSSRTYFKVQTRVNEIVKEVAVEEMLEGAKKEAQIACDRGEVDKDGCPLLTVVVDGSWAKRSYRSSYNSLSGVGCIMGFYTGKVLYVGIRNIFCAICAKAENVQKVIPTHICYKNWDKSANAMEADIIAEGFCNSIEMYGAKYMRVIGDGDSSTMEKLRTIRPYGLDQVIQKIECANHVCRNFNNKLKEMIRKKEIPLSVRKKLKENLSRFRIGIHCAIKKRATEEGISMDQREKFLKLDFINIPHHIFGDHDNCKGTSTQCDGVKENEINEVPFLKDTLFWLQLNDLIKNALIKHISSLVYNVTNNHAEAYNSSCAKWNGGKRLKHK